MIARTVRNIYRSLRICLKTILTISLLKKLLVRRPATAQNAAVGRLNNCNWYYSFHFGELKKDNKRIEKT